MTEWISVKDRLPEQEKEVLFCFQSRNMVVGFWIEDTTGEKRWCAVSDDGWYTDCENQPVYWAELPKPPKEADNG